MKRLYYRKTNLGFYSSESQLCRLYENLNNCEIQRTETSLSIYRSETLVLNMRLTKIEEDNLSVVYSAIGFDNTQIRVCCINPALSQLFGDTISFASIHKDGFAVHFDLI
ncbi:MAG: hypothetical protein ACI31F_04850 [Muribaculaceae bacterium]